MLLSKTCLHEKVTLTQIFHVNKYSVLAHVKNSDYIIATLMTIYDSLYNVCT